MQIKRNHHGKAEVIRMVEMPSGRASYHVLADSKMGFPCGKSAQCPLDSIVNPTLNMSYFNHVSLFKL